MSTNVHLFEGSHDLLNGGDDDDDDDDDNDDDDDYNRN